MTDDTTPDAAVSGRLRQFRNHTSPIALYTLLDEAADCIDALIARAVAAEKRATNLETTAKEDLAYQRKLEAQVARLQGIVEQAPHEDTCAIRLSPDAGYPCSCWKRDAILSAAEKEGE